MVSPRRPVERNTPHTGWASEAGIRRQVQLLHGRLGHANGALAERHVALLCEPETLAQMAERYDPAQAVADGLAREAFRRLYDLGQSWDTLDPVMQRMAARFINTIYRRAAGLERRRGQNPLDEGQAMVVQVCKALAHHNLRRPLGVSIQAKLNRAENGVMRAMRQIKSLVTHRLVREAFKAYVLGAEAEDELKGQLLWLAESGELTGVNYEAAVAFFSRRETVAFVLQFADRVQPARTLYSEDAYERPHRGAIADPRFRGALRERIAAAAMDEGLKERLLRALRGEEDPRALGDAAAALLEADPTAQELADDFAGQAPAETLPWTGRRISAKARRGYIEAATAGLQSGRHRPLATTDAEEDGDASDRSETAYHLEATDDDDPRFSALRRPAVIA